METNHARQILEAPEAPPAKSCSSLTDYYTEDVAPRLRGARETPPFQSLMFKRTTIVHPNILKVSPILVFKFAIGYIFDDSIEEKKKKNLMERHRRARYSIDEEGLTMGRIAQALRSHPCDHIIQPSYHVNEGLFLPLLKCDINERLRVQNGEPEFYADSKGHLPETPIPMRLKVRWMDQIANSLAWLENIGLGHGDLRPANILLDHFDNVVLADFGSTNDMGLEQRSSCPPYVPDGFVYITKRSEQYAYAWTLYNIFHGSVPEDFELVHDKEPVFPKVKHLPCGELIRYCWYNQYDSVAHMRHIVRQEYRRLQPWYYQLLDLGCLMTARFLRYWRRNSILIEMDRVYEGIWAANEAGVEWKEGAIVMH